MALFELMSVIWHTKTPILQTKICKIGVKSRFVYYVTAYLTE